MGQSNSTPIAERRGSCVAGYTFLGAGCGRCKCSAPNSFVRGANNNGCCGTAGVDSYDENPAFPEAVRDRFEEALEEAGDIAGDVINRCSYVWAAQCDTSSLRAANRLNEEWVQKQNEWLAKHELRCYASSEVHGFGRSRIVSCIIRVRAVTQGGQNA